MVSTRPLISKASSPCSNHLLTVPRSPITISTVPNPPITIGIVVTYMFHSFFNSLARSSYFSFFLHSFSFILWSAGTAKSTILQVIIIINIIIIICPLLLVMVFYWSLSDSKYPQISRTQHSILADLKNAVVWMVSIRRPISNFSSWRPFQAHHLQLASPILSCSTAFYLILWRGPSTSLLFFLWISLCDLLGRLNAQNGRLSVFVN